LDRCTLFFLNQQCIGLAEEDNKLAPVFSSLTNYAGIGYYFFMESRYEQHLRALSEAGRVARKKAEEALKPQAEITEEIPLSLGEVLDRQNSQAILNATNSHALPAQNPHARELHRHLTPRRGSPAVESH
jgi:hypothetical protein